MKRKIFKKNKKKNSRGGEKQQKCRLSPWQAWFLTGTTGLWPPELFSVSLSVFLVSYCVVSVVLKSCLQSSNLGIYACF